MQAREVTGLNHLLLPSNPSPHPLNYTTIHNNNDITPTLQYFQGFSNQLCGFQSPPQLQPPHGDYLSPNSPWCVGSNSTSDEADDQQLGLTGERRHRRMISNRESARRSRVRKQRHLDELWSQVVWLRNENQQLADTLSHVSGSHDQALQENARLKEEASELRQMMSGMQIHAPPCPSSFDQLSVSSSMDLLA